MQAYFVHSSVTADPHSHLALGTLSHDVWVVCKDLLKEELVGLLGFLLFVCKG